MFGIKDYCVKPVTLVKLCDYHKEPSRVTSLLKLAARCIAKLYVTSGLDKETRSSSKLSDLKQYFSVLPLTAREILYNSILKALSYSTLGKTSCSSEASFVAWILLSSHSSSLELSEFIGDGGGKEIFEHIIQSHSNFNHIRKVSLGSESISVEKLSYYFEVTDYVWKPKLETFLSHLQITHLILRYFCDDDTLSLVGRHCVNLQYLEVHLFPESINEQQVTDDGFDELISAQSRRPTLKELNLKECFSHSLSSRTLLSLSRISTLSTLYVRSFHFCWLKLTLRFNSGAYPPNTSLTHLAINFFSAGDTELFDDRPKFIDGVPETVFVQGILQFIPTLFPQLKTVELEGIQNDVLMSGNIGPSLFDLVRKLRIRRCPDIMKFAKMLPNLTSLEVDCFPLNGEVELEEDSKFSKVTELTINKGSYRHGLDLMDLRRMLSGCPAIKEIRLKNVTLQTHRPLSNTTGPITEDEFLDLLRTLPHLRNLTTLVIQFSGEGQLTERSVYHLLDNCPNLERVENLLSWRLHRDSLDPQLLKDKYGFGMRFGSRQHWSLHWRAEDGTFYDSEIPVDRF